MMDDVTNITVPSFLQLLRYSFECTVQYYQLSCSCLASLCVSRGGGDDQSVMMQEFFLDDDDDAIYGYFRTY